MATLGRPRRFDRDVVLKRAMRAFWQHGYETTSLAELTRAMGITSPSLYAAFGDKRALFLEAVARYQAYEGAYAEQAITGERTARSAVEQLLLDAAAAFTDPSNPPGCMVISATTNCTPREAEMQSTLRDMRLANEAALRDRIARGISVGELPPTADATVLARFYGTVLQGMSSQARDGASRTDLEAVARQALLAWPGSHH